jgi:L-proline amide hydrolase
VHRINVPTLIINGEYDEAADVAIRPFLDSIVGVKWVKFANCSHTSHLEAPGKFIQAVVDFLNS